MIINVTSNNVRMTFATSLKNWLVSKVNNSINLCNNSFKFSESVHKSLVLLTIYYHDFRILVNKPGFPGKRLIYIYWPLFAVGKT